MRVQPKSNFVRAVLKHLTAVKRIEAWRGKPPFGWRVVGIDFGLGRVTVELER